MLITLIVIVLFLLWITGYFGTPVIPETTLPTLHIAWSNPLMHAVLIVVVIVIIIALVRG